MTLESLDREWLGAYLSGAWAAAAAALFFVTMGYLSLRFLRGLPDFPDKPAMMRGAKWGGLVFAGLIAATMAVVFAGIWFMHRPISSAIAGKVVLYGGLSWLALRLEVEFEGMGAFGVRLRVKGTDPDKWLAELTRRREQSKKWRWVAPVCLVAVVVMYLGVGVWVHQGMESWMVAMAREGTFSQKVRQEIGSLAVLEVRAGGPAVFQSAVYPMWVYVGPDVAGVQAAQIAERTRQILAARHEKLCWRIIVKPEHGGKLAQAYYVPEGMTLPPNADQIRPQPRDE